MGIGTRSDALTMFDTLAGNSYIQSVDLSQNEVDDDCVSSISLALLDNKSVMYLNLADNAIYSEGAECACAGSPIAVFFNGSISHAFLPLCVRSD